MTVGQNVMLINYFLVIFSKWLLVVTTRQLLRWQPLRPIETDHCDYDSSRHCHCDTACVLIGAVKSRWGERNPHNMNS